MIQFYLPIVIMSIIISVMIFTFLCSLTTRSKARSSTVPVQSPKIKYNTPQTPVTNKETTTKEIEDLIQPAIVDPEYILNKMKYYSDETVNELR